MLLEHQVYGKKNVSLKSAEMKKGESDMTWNF
jgi:hypothetical protein